MKIFPYGMRIKRENLIRIGPCKPRSPNGEFQPLSLPPINGEVDSIYPNSDMDGEIYSDPVPLTSLHTRLHSSSCGPTCYPIKICHM